MNYDLIRSLLFRLDPEYSHHLTLKGLEWLSRLGPWNPMRVDLPAHPRTVMGLVFKNPVGLAAGLDKDGLCMEGLAALGFGFIEIGTVTPRPQPGNPRPRLFRVEAAEAIINRMGFNNAGVDALLQRIERTQYQGILGINLGKNKDTPGEEALSDYLTGLRRVYARATYVTINISSPNTPGLRDLQSSVYLDALVGGLMEERARLEILHAKKVPLVVKIAPDLTPGEVEALADCLLRHKVDGVIATNTTISREGVDHLPHGREAGGLSGRPVFERSTRIVHQLATILNGRLAIIACGGIFNPDDAARKMDAGASLVQIYSGLIYRGPQLVQDLVRALD